MKNPQFAPYSDISVQTDRHDGAQGDNDIQIFVGSRTRKNQARACKPNCTCPVGTSHLDCPWADPK